MKIILIFLLKIKETISMIFWLRPENPGEKGTFNFKGMIYLAVIVILVFIYLAVKIPKPAEVVTEFKEELPVGQQSDHTREREIADIQKKAQGAFGGNGTLSGLSLHSMGGGADLNQNTSGMIIARPGTDGVNQLPAGTRFTMRIDQDLTISDDSTPVIGTVIKGYQNELGLGIEENSKIYGSIQFQRGSDRATLMVRAIELTSHQTLALQGIGLDESGEAGIKGEIHSHALTNAMGQFITRFIGSYAEGTMQRDILGNSTGGVQNGLLNATADTAKDRSQAFAEDLKKEKEWMEIKRGTVVTVILTTPFAINPLGSTP